jgi:hypothetical protein
MPVPTLITDLSTTAASNSPATTESPGDGDNYIRAHASFIALLYSYFSTQGLFGNGSVGAPSVSFASDTDSGFYRIGANSVGWATGGTLRFQVDASATTSYLNHTVSLTSAATYYTANWNANNTDAGAVERGGFRFITKNFNGTSREWGLYGNTTNLDSDFDAGLILATVDSASSVSALTLAASGAATFIGSVTADSFSGDASASDLTSGTLPAARVSGAVAYDLSASTVDSVAIGYRNMPTLANTATATAVNGKCYLNTAGITINNGVHSAGDVFCVYNNSAASINITAGTITTMRLGGTATTGTRALAARGLATLFFPTATECVVTGSGVT